MADYNPQVTVKKGWTGAIYGLIAVIVAAIAQALAGYSFGSDVPAWVNQIWMVFVPAIVGGLKALSNWLKNKDVANG